MSMILYLLITCFQLGFSDLSKEDIQLGYEMALLAQHIYSFPPTSGPSLPDEGKDLGWETQDTLTSQGIFSTKTVRSCVMLTKNDKEKRCATVFQGTIPTDLTEWIFTNFAVVPECMDRAHWLNMGFCKEGAHKGFVELYLQLTVDGDNGSKFKKFAESCDSQGYEMVFTGHSLGAAEAAIAGASLHDNVNAKLDKAYSPDKIRVVTFGEPRPFIEGCPALINEKTQIRFVATTSKHEADLVPQVPPLYSNCVGGYQLQTDTTAGLIWDDNHSFPYDPSNRWGKSVSLHSMKDSYLKKIRTLAGADGRLVLAQNFVSSHLEYLALIVLLAGVSGCVVTMRKKNLYNEIPAEEMIMV